MTATQRITSRAHQILDRVRCNRPASRAIVNWALQRTGDLPRLGLRETSRTHTHLQSKGERHGTKT